jgi:hypothetical protein
MAMIFSIFYFEQLIIFGTIILELYVIAILISYGTYIYINSKYDKNLFTEMCEWVYNQSVGIKINDDKDNPFFEIDNITKAISSSFEEECIQLFENIKLFNSFSDNKTNGIEVINDLTESTFSVLKANFFVTLVWVIGIIILIVLLFLEECDFCVEGCVNVILKECDFGVEGSVNVRVHLIMSSIISLACFIVLSILNPRGITVNPLYMFIVFGVVVQLIFICSGSKTTGIRGMLIVLSCIMLLIVGFITVAFGIFFHNFGATKMIFNLNDLTIEEVISKIHQTEKADFPITMICGGIIIFVQGICFASFFCWEDCDSPLKSLCKKDGFLV